MIIRCRAEQIEQNEKNTKYFANLEKNRANSKTINKLIDNGKEITNINDILNVEMKFFQNLYSKQTNNDNSNELQSVPITKLNEDDRNKIEGKLTEYECKIALNEMQNNKSPGSDGISVEFYKLFWDDLSTYFIKSINYSFDIGELTVLQKQGVITLLPKQGKDLNQTGNWRPISLLNVDYKIATKTIANRIKTVLYAWF